MNKIIFGLIAAQAVLINGSASAQDAAPAADGGMWQTIIILGIGVAFFYFIMLRPEKKRHQALEEMRNALAKGDRVTAMGILGTVSQIKENTVILNMVDGAKIEVIKGAITEIVSDKKEEA